VTLEVEYMRAGMLYEASSTEDRLALLLQLSAPYLLHRPSCLNLYHLQILASYPFYQIIGFKFGKCLPFIINTNKHEV
jgi:hypothetical protein